MGQRCLPVCRLGSHSPPPPDRAHSRYGIACRGDCEQELEIGCCFGGHGGSGLPRRDPGQCAGPVDVVVVAAGNSNSDACNFSPAFADNAITVGSTTSTDTRSGFSNYGRCVNIWAPGSAVLSAGIRSDTSSSTKSGTSMACPHVSGAAALVLSGNPTMKSSAVLGEMLDIAYLN